MKSLHKHKSWVSTQIIKVLNHNLNFSTWTDTYACAGHWKIELSNDLSKIEIYMPTARWGEEHSGYFTLYSGRLEIVNNELLIWQNEDCPIKLKYTESTNHISLNILNHSIKFEKKEENVQNKTPNNLKNGRNYFTFWRRLFRR